MSVSFLSTLLAQIATPLGRKLPPLHTERVRTHTEEQEWLIGNPQAFAQMVGQLRRQAPGNTQALQTPEGWNSKSIFFRRTLLTHLNLDSDPFPEQLLVLDYVMAATEGEQPKTISFLLRIDGQSLEIPTGEGQLLQGAVISVVDVASRQDLQNPFDNFSVLKDGNRDVLQYSACDDFEDSQDCKMVLIPADSQTAFLTSSRQRFIASLDEVVSRILRQVDYLSIQAATVQNAEGKKAGEAATKTVAALYESVNPLLQGVSHYVDRNDPLSAWSENILSSKGEEASFKATQTAKETEAQGLMRSKQGDELKRREEVARGLRLYEELIKARNAFLKNSALPNTTHHNYALYKAQGTTGYDLKEMKRLHQAILQEDAQRVKTLIEDLKRFKEAKRLGIEPRLVKDIMNVSIHHDEIFEMFPDYVKSLAPPGSPAVHPLSPEQAQQVAIAFFKDMDMDLTKPPFDKIVVDLKVRDQKRSGGFSTPRAEDGAYILAYVAKDEYSLSDVATLMHEYSHAIHEILSNEAAKGSRTRGFNLAPEVFIEGSAFLFNRIAFSESFIKRYLGEYEGYRDDKVRKIVSEAYAQRFAALNVFNSTNAIIEIELYDAISKDPDTPIATHLQALLNRYYTPLGAAPDPLHLIRFAACVVKPGITGNYPFGYRMARDALPSLLTAFENPKAVNLLDLKESGKKLKAAYQNLNLSDPRRAFEALR